MLYSNEDIKRLKDNFPVIDEQIKEMILENITPKRDEIVAILSVIRDFIKDNNRIIYGGIAHNEAIKDKSPKDALYGPNDYGDYDFYSPTPLEDIVKIADILHAKGYAEIYCREALHEETYSVTVNFNLYCDITYMPKYIFDNMPVKNIKGIRYVHPHVAIIDYLRMFTDPMFSSFRWEKSIKRVKLLESFYPFTKKDSKYVEVTSDQADLDIMFNILIRDTVIFVDDYAYNYYVEKSEGKGYIPICNYVVVSTKYAKDCNDIYKTMQQKFGTVTYKEYFPFFQFTGKSIQFYVKNVLILTVIDYNEVCLPYFNKKAINFHTKSKTDKDILIAPVPLTLLFYLIFGLYFFINKSQQSVNYYNRVADLVALRNRYLKKNKLTVFDETIFREFNTKCIGETITLHQKKKRSKDVSKQQYRFSYDPAKDGKVNTRKSFDNTSGNIIKNQKDSVIRTQKRQ